MATTHTQKEFAVRSWIDAGCKAGDPTAKLAQKILKKIQHTETIADGAYDSDWRWSGGATFGTGGIKGELIDWIWNNMFTKTEKKKAVR